MATLAKHDDQRAPRSPTMTQQQRTTLQLGTLSLSPSSSVTSSASDLKLMLLMDPYGLMDAQPTKLLTSNATLPTETDADSLTYGLPSVLGSSSMYEEEEYFDPYNTNIYGSSIKRQVSSNSLSSTASRLMEAKQQASFYLEQTTANDCKEEEEALLFQEADEKATRLETARRDVSFYLQEQFHDALESSSDEEDDEANASLEHFQDEDNFQDTVSDLLLVNTAALPANSQEDNFQDCNQTEQDATPIKSHSPTNVDFYLHELQDNGQVVDLKQEAEIDFYLQQENLQRDLIDLEEEPTPSPVIEKIACTTHRLDMDGAIRHKTIFYGDSPEVPASKTLSFEDESGWSSASSTPTSQESKVEAMLPLHAPTPPLPATAAASEEPITSILDEDTKVTRVSLDKYISAKVANIVFQNPQQMTQKRREITIQRIDMAGILQPTQIYGPFLDGNFEDEPTDFNPRKPNVDQPAYSVATTLKQHDQKMRAIMAQQQEQVGCGCGWSVFGWFKKR